MVTLILLGLLGGLVTGISPCILPVLPVIFWTGGADSARFDESDPNASQKPRVSKWRPYQVVGGLVLSFSLFTLLGSLILNALNLPQDIVRWVGIVFLVLVGIGMIVPRFEHILEKPFSWVPQRQVNTRRGGFLMGLALGVVYVPCAGPILAAITVAGATGNIGVDTVALTIAFALGTAIPLLFFALAGRSLAERMKTFRRRQRGIRITAGALLICLAVGLAFNLPATLQRLVPNYTASAEEFIDRGTRAANSQNGIGSLGGCKEAEKDLQDCGTAPELKGTGTWFNTPNQQALSLEKLKGKVVLVDFWAYSCINCQRSIPHLNAWYDKYKDSGLEIIGVHSPEYAFEHETKNVAAGVKEQKIQYPVAQDNDFATWNAYQNRYWPAHYLIDSEGKLRATKFGEGDYDVTESQIRQLLKQANPNVELPAPAEEAGDAADDIQNNPHGNVPRTPETYLGTDRASAFAGSERYTAGTQDFADDAPQRDDAFTLKGRWNLSAENIEPASSDASITLNFRGKVVQVVASGTGTIGVDTPSGHQDITLNNDANSYDLLRGDEHQSGAVTLTLSPGVKLYSFTFG